MHSFSISWSALIAPLLFGIIGFILTPTIVSYSDTTTIINSLNDSNKHWPVYITTAPAGSIEKARIIFKDPILTGSVAASASLDLGNGETIVFDAKTGDAKTGDAKTGDAKIGTKELTPDEARITRHLKQGRIISVTPSQPPKNFSAGSISGKQSASSIAKISPETAMVFKKSSIKGKEIQIASTFYKKQQPRPLPRVPSILAHLITNDNADILATAYAPPAVDYTKNSPFTSILREKKDDGRFIPPIEKSDHAWAATPLPVGAFSANEQRCLTTGIYFEARGEEPLGQAAVSQVILNRVRNPAYPDTICAVVYQNKYWRNHCQFSFACDGIRDRVLSQKAWNIAKEVALATSAGTIWLKQVGSSTHYHAAYVRPEWAKSMRRVGRIGLHIFYITHGGGWS